MDEISAIVRTGVNYVENFKDIILYLKKVDAHLVQTQTDWNNIMGMKSSVRSLDDFTKKEMLRRSAANMGHGLPVPTPSSDQRLKHNLVVIGEAREQRKSAEKRAGQAGATVAERRKAV